MKGKNFLKVTGILMIIGGAISTIVGLIALIGTLAVSSLLTGSGLLGWMIIGSVLCLISGVAELIAGIFGVSHCEKPEKAHTCILWGCIVVGLCVLGNIFNVIGGGSVVTKDIPANVVAAGNPCKVLREIGERDEK